MRRRGGGGEGGGDGGVGGQQIGRQTPALSQMIERSSASQETVSKHYQATVKKTKQTKKTDFWLLVSDTDLQTARPPASAGSSGSSAGPRGQHNCRTHPRVKRWSRNSRKR